MRISHITFFKDFDDERHFKDLKPCRTVLSLQSRLVRNELQCTKSVGASRLNEDSLVRMKKIALSPTCCIAYINAYMA